MISAKRSPAIAVLADLEIHRREPAGHGRAHREVRELAVSDREIPLQLFHLALDLRELTDAQLFLLAVARVLHRLEALVMGELVLKRIPHLRWLAPLAASLPRRARARSRRTTSYSICSSALRLPMRICSSCVS